MKLQKQSEMQDFFDALGIDENIFEQMAETFTSNFMIEGKTTTDLNEMLSRAPESLLDVILETWEEEAPKLRAEKEKAGYSCSVMWTECSLLFRMRSESLLSQIWRRIRCKIYLVLLPLSAFPCERV